MLCTRPFLSYRRLNGTLILTAGIVLILTGCSNVVVGTPLDKTATTAAQATTDMQDKLNVISPKLEKLGYNLDSGTLVYYRSSSEKIEPGKLMGLKGVVIVDKPISDFILQADIDWNAISGLAGCGIMFRADEDFRQGSGYQLFMLRIADVPAWDIAYILDGKIQYNLLPYSQFTDAVDEREGAVNTITLIVTGDTIETLINTAKGRTRSIKSFPMVALFCTHAGI